MGNWFKNHWAVLSVLLVALLLTGLVHLRVLSPRPEPIILSTATPLPSPEATPTPEPLHVYVSGAVRRPDVHIVAPGSIVKDALLAAGGPADDADLDRINLAMQVVDGQHIYVPYLGEEGLPVEVLQEQSRASGIEGVGGLININTADQRALESLPGIGPALAERIVAYRQQNGAFAQPADLMDVSGIGPATFEQIRELITTH